MTQSDTSLAQRPLLGMALVVAATFVFASMDANGKYLAQYYPVPFFLFVRYLVNLLLLVVVFAPRHGWDLLKVQRKGLVILRGFALASSSLCAGFALKAMPVAETTAIIYLAPFGVVLLSGPLLGEKVLLSSWIATAIGFLGLLLIVRPGAGLSPVGVMFGLLTIGGTIIYHMLSRSLAKTESTMALLFYTAVVGTLVFGVWMPWNIPTITPGMIDTVALLGMGVFSFAGHFLFTAGYREAPVSLLVPVNYMHLVWATILGWLAFNHMPDGLSMIGIALVAAAGAGNALYTHFTREQAAALTPEEV